MAISVPAIVGRPAAERRTYSSGRNGEPLVVAAVSVTRVSY